MKSCPMCLNLIEESAVSCGHCGRVIDPSAVADARRPVTRAETVAEGRSSATVPFSPVRPSPPPPPRSAPPSAAPPSDRPARRGETVFLRPAGDDTGSARYPATGGAKADSRRIVAVLITYSWRPEGQIFPVREGRNLIGRGEECAIRIEEDPVLSQVNTHITYRQNFMVGDMVSMSGTDLNGQPIEEQFHPIENYARLRTGSTNWTFVILDEAMAGRGA